MSLDMPGGLSRTGLIALAAIGGALLITPATAAARPACDKVGNPCRTGPKTAPGQVQVNPGYTLTVRAKPKGRSKKVRELPNGAPVVIVCQANGQRVRGRFGTSRLWDKLANGGFVSDTYIYTGSDGRVAPECKRRRGKPKQDDAPHPEQDSGKRPRSVALKNNYPFKRRSPDSADKWGFYYRECTSFVAFRLNRLRHFRFTNYMAGGHFGDAGNWDNNARALGYRVNKRPTVGSVMVRDSGTWGHVAIVAKVKRNRFMIEEYNHDVSHGYSKRWISRSANGDWDHFIHFRQ